MSSRSGCPKASGLGWLMEFDHCGRRMGNDAARHYGSQNCISNTNLIGGPHVSRVVRTFEFVWGDAPWPQSGTHESDLMKRPLIACVASSNQLTMC